jgi:hypothetical protein
MGRLSRPFLTFLAILLVSATLIEKQIFPHSIVEMMKLFGERNPQSKSA